MRTRPRPRPKMTRYYMGIPQIVSIYDFFRKIVNFQNVTVFWMFYFCDHFSEFFKNFWLDFMTKQGLMYFLFHISSILLFDITIHQNGLVRAHCGLEYIRLNSAFCPSCFLRHF